MAVTNENGTISTTATKIILRAHRILGNKGAGEVLTGAEADEGLDALNTLLDSFSIQRLMIYQVRQESLTWPANTTSRTIGSGADFDTHRPDRIENGTIFRDSSNIDYPVQIAKDRYIYDNITDKTVTSSYPEILMYDPSSTWGTLYVYPVPNQALTLLLNTWQPLQVFDTLTEVVHMPAGYKRMLEYNLAQELESEVGLPLSQGARKIANDSKKAVKRNNSPITASASETYYVLNQGRRPDIYMGK